MRKLIAAFVLVSAISLSSCYKEPENGIAIIRVYDTNYLAPGAQLHIYQHGSQSNWFIDFTAMTDTHGEYVYEHDPALQVILEVDVTYNGHTGHGIVNIEPNKTTTTVIHL